MSSSLLMTKLNRDISSMVPYKRSGPPSPIRVFCTISTPLPMFGASRNVFQRIARMGMRNGASHMSVATSAAKSYSASSLFAVFS